MKPTGAPNQIPPFLQLDLEFKHAWMLIYSKRPQPAHDFWRLQVPWSQSVSNLYLHVPLKLSVHNSCPSQAAPTATSSKGRSNLTVHCCCCLLVTRINELQQSQNSLVGTEAFLHSPSHRQQHSQPEQNSQKELQQCKYCFSENESMILLHRMIACHPARACLAPDWRSRVL